MQTIDRLTKHLAVYEYLPRREYELYKSGKLPIRIIDWRLIRADEAFIQRYGTTLINDWYFGGPSEMCGYRPWDCDVGANYSAHRHGRASDKHPKKTTWHEIAKDVIWQPDIFLKMGFAVVENTDKTLGWFHLEVGQQNKNTLQIVNP